MTTDKPSAEKSTILAYGYFLSGLLAHDTGTDSGKRQEYTAFKQAEGYLASLHENPQECHTQWVDILARATKTNVRYFAFKHGTKAYKIKEQNFVADNDTGVPAPTPRQLPRQESILPEEQYQAA